MIDHDPVESAWRVHSAVVDWTGKVDTKASFTLAAESATALAVLTLSGGGRRLGGITGLPWQIGYWTGVTVLAIAIVLVLIVVRPRLRVAESRGEASNNFIYFGHAKQWDAVKLAEALRTRDILPVLTRQIVVMSSIASTKHKMLQWSINLAVVSVVVLVVVAALRP